LKKFRGGIFELNETQTNPESYEHKNEKIATEKSAE